jgi:hypothetical protein
VVGGVVLLGLAIKLLGDLDQDSQVRGLRLLLKRPRDMMEFTCFMLPRTSVLVAMHKEEAVAAVHGRGICIIAKP